jgi:hypothetical protein
MTQIVHVVSWRVAGASDGERRRHAQAVADAVESTRGRIPGLRSLDVGVNLIPSADAWDVGAVMVFDSRADLDAYQDHPAHLALKAAVGPLRIARAQFDIVRRISSDRPPGEAR